MVLFKSSTSSMAFCLPVLLVIEKFVLEIVHCPCAPVNSKIPVTLHCMDFKASWAHMHPGSGGFGVRRTLAACSTYLQPVFGLGVFLISSPCSCFPLPSFPFSSCNFSLPLCLDCQFYKECTRGFCLSSFYK